MLDAKKILDMMMGGSPREQDQTSPAAEPRYPQATASKPAASPVDDLLGSLGSLLGGEGQKRAANDERVGTPAASSGLSDILAKLQDPKTLESLKQKMSTTGGGVMDVLGRVYRQATEGTKEGARDIGEAAGLRDLVGQLTAKLGQGRTPEQVIAELKSLIANNKLASGAALGGLGALILGTQTGRSIALGTAKIGAVALIGGLAYKAYQNYKAGKPLLTGAEPGDTPEAAPKGSGFEPAAVSNATATVFLRAMIAAAAADGRVDPTEREALLAGMRQSGLAADAEAFLDREIAKPATVAEIAATVTTKEEAVQVYTAARLAITPESDSERVFLGSLATALGIEDELARHIDATAVGTITV